jgi:threonine dehydrogenase-like Zn-dependent dehydrogenase
MSQSTQYQEVQAALWYAAQNLRVEHVSVLAINDPHAVMALMQRGYFRAEDMVTQRIPVEDIVEEGFEALLSDKAQVKSSWHPATKPRIAKHQQTQLIRCDAKSP